MTGVSFNWIEAPVGKQHDRDAFDCGDDDLNIWFARYARQSHIGGGAKTFVASPVDAPKVAMGFYSVSPTSLDRSDVPPHIGRGLGRYEVPLFRLGRLAVDRGFQGNGLGGSLLLAAVQRCESVAAEVGGIGLLIDAKSERGALWYESYGAERMQDAPLTLILPFASVLSERPANR